MGFTVEKGSEKGSERGSEKGASRRCLERPLGEYDPLGVHPKNCFVVFAVFVIPVVFARGNPCAKHRFGKP